MKYLNSYVTLNNTIASSSQMTMDTTFIVLRACDYGDVLCAPHKIVARACSAHHFRGRRLYEALEVLVQMVLGVPL